MLDYFPPEKRQQAFSLSAVAIIIAPVLGPVRRRLPDRHLFLALDLPDQRADRRAHLVRRRALRRRLARWRGTQGRAARSTMSACCFIWLALGCLEVGVRPRRGLRLAGLDLHPRHVRPVACRLHCSASRTCSYARPDREPAGVQGPQLRHRLVADRADGLRALRSRGADPAIRAAAARLQRHLGRAGAGAGRHRAGRADSHRQQGDERRPGQIRDRLSAAWRSARRCSSR